MHIKNISIDDITEGINKCRITDKKKIENDPDLQTLCSVCHKFIGKKCKLLAIFDYDDKTTPISNCNIVGDVLENVFYQRLREKLPLFKNGPKQKSPDFWNRNKKYEYELKCFTKSPSFDLSNFRSYITQLCETNGVYRKLFQTKYLIFEYSMNKNIVTIERFNLLNIWNIVGYNGKYPITLQNKNNMWYNIRPASMRTWGDKSKNADKFIENIILSIKQCPNKIPDKNKYIKNIENQYKIIKSQYNIK